MVTGEIGQPFQTAPILVVVEQNIVHGSVTTQAQPLVVCGAKATGHSLNTVTQIHAQGWRHIAVFSS